MIEKGLIFSVLMVVSVVEANYVYEKQLYKKLLQNYQPAIRPAEFDDRPIDVEFQIEILKLRTYELKEQILTLTAFTMMHWRDPQLTWNASDYGGKQRMNFGSNEIWTPDVVLYNSAYEEREYWTDTYPSKAIVLSDGNVLWHMPVIWYVACQSDITWFPVDQQECTLQFGSWSYSQSQLRVSPWQRNSIAEKPETIPNGQWKIKSVSAEFINKSFTCCPEAFSMVHYTIAFDHLSSFYFIYIILPMVALCFMFPLMFIIPIDSGERLGYGTTILLSVTVYLLVISDKLPEKSDVQPMLGITFVGEFFILCFGLVIAAVTMVIHSNQKAGPNFLRRLARVTLKQRKSESKEVQLNAYVNENGKFAASDEVFSNTSTENSQKLSTKHKIKEDWEILAKSIDRFGLVFTYLMVIIFPIIVYLSLDKSGLQ